MVKMIKRHLNAIVCLKCVIVAEQCKREASTFFAIFKTTIIALKHHDFEVGAILQKQGC